MRSDVYKFSGTEVDLAKIDETAAKVAAYANLGRKEQLRLVLLSEELLEMIPNLLRYGDGEFWIDCSGSKFEIHAVVYARDNLSSLERDDLIGVSKSGRNAAATGIVNKIRVAAETFFANYALTAGSTGVNADGMNAGMANFCQLGMYDSPMGYSQQWSLSNYRNRAAGDSEAWDELEKSIIANIADDVTVGILNNTVEITVKKSF